jgi:transcription termination factor Rho
MDKQEETKLQGQIDKLKADKVKSDNINNLKKQIDDLTQKVEELSKKNQGGSGRIRQQDILPGAIKNRAMGEANSYFYAGLLADRPDGVSFGKNVNYYFSTDTNVLYIFDGTVWRSH